VDDFNGDGKLDVALTNSVGPTNAVAIVSGNGDGTFQSPPILYSAGLLPAGVVSVDVNGDGKPDLAVAGGDGVASYFSLTTLINRGDGTFTNPVTFPVLQYPYSAVTGDFNSDGNMDIATTSLNPDWRRFGSPGKGRWHVSNPSGLSHCPVSHRYRSRRFQRGWQVGSGGSGLNCDEPVVHPNRQW